MIEKSQDQKIFETMRDGLMGGGAGIAIASIAGGVLGSVIPVVGTVIGSTIGVMIAGAWGGKLAIDHKGNKNKETARREVMSVIDKELSNILAEATSELNKATFTLRSKADESIRMIITQAKERLSSQRASLQKRRNADHKTLTDDRARYGRQLKELEQITTQFDHREKEIV
jgi:gas vesicle protein